MKTAKYLAIAFILAIACLFLLNAAWNWLWVNHLAIGEVGVPCLPYYSELRPLLVGQTVRLQVGATDGSGSDCPTQGVTQQAWAWTISDPKIAEIERNGMMRGIASGMFAAIAQQGNIRLEARGFVLPPGWTVRIEPSEATIKVGDRVMFRVFAYDTDGKKLPPVPYSIHTPGFFNPGAIEPILVDRASHQNDPNPASFRAIEPGTTILTGEIADRQAKAKLVVLP